MKGMISPDLPYDEFLYISSKTPLINVDLLIEDEKQRLLFSWRDDEYSGTGWHIIGGIIRVGETLEDRLIETARREIGFVPQYDKAPCKITEFIFDQEYRRHYISLLYHCKCDSKQVENNARVVDSDTNVEVGDLRWFTYVPEKLIWAHEDYRYYLESFFENSLK